MQLAPRSKECRRKEDECDLEEYCDGQRAVCPEDVFAVNGLPCDGGRGYCHDGNCPQRPDQCIKMYGVGECPWQPSPATCDAASMLIDCGHQVLPRLEGTATTRTPEGATTRSASGQPVTSTSPASRSELPPG